MNTRNVHGMFKCIYIEHKNLEIRKTPNDFSVQVRKLFLLPLSVKVLRHKERLHILSILAFSTAPHLVRHLPKASASKRKSTLLVRCPVLNSPLTFLNLPKSSARIRCMTSPALCSSRFPSGLWWHLWVTRPLRARAWTPVLMLHLSNPCTEPEGFLA